MINIILCRTHPGRIKLRFGSHFVDIHKKSDYVRAKKRELCKTNVQTGKLIKNPIIFYPFICTILDTE